MIARYAAVLGMIIGAIIMMLAAPDGIFNGLDFIGWALFILATLRVLRPVRKPRA